MKSQRKSLTYNTGCSEEPEEEPVQDHGNVFPVLNNLSKNQIDLQGARPAGLTLMSRSSSNLELSVGFESLFSYDFRFI